VLYDELIFQTYVLSEHKAGMGNLFTITGHMNCGIMLTNRKNSLILFLNFTFIFLRKIGKKTTSRNKRYFSWLTFCVCFELP